MESENDWDGDDDGPGIDFRFDGDGYLGPLAPDYDRRIGDKLKRMVQSILEGGEIEPLEEMLQGLYTGFDKAIKHCQRKAAQDSAGAPLQLANVEAYNLALDAIEEMDEALGEENHVVLQEGLACLTEAITQINLGGARRSDRVSV